ncbi:MAG: US12 family protein [Lachnospiraceae bacterium]|nr:US12 family protein [Lachnospiraceae bacterium]
MDYQNNGNGSHFGNENDQTPQQYEQTAANAAAATSFMQHSGIGALSNQIAENFEPATAENAITDQRYNITIGVMLLYGFLVNAIMCFVFEDGIIGFVSDIHPLLFFIGYMVAVLVGTLICAYSKSAVGCFVGYNLIVLPMGLMITPLINLYQVGTVRYAFTVLCVMTMVMIGLAVAFQDFFLSIGRMLMACFLIAFVGMLVLFAFNVDLGPFDYIFVGIFSLFIGYDWAVAQRVPKTTQNAIRSASMLYVDMINLLIRLLRILAKNRD